ncbi:PREDICTED: cell division cycle protein 123 homolog [Trachymyrmex septentrionalis]|uniref:cell division cycle protein 123 homolog n=1 Tax=Trachymyrmex septentrionalis TaxID=34720 RepID=UPI00084F4680|nr:PREDICTED: cell division cycle protein 123 homolog [Trachymyrmex septentrionalis]
MVNDLKLECSFSSWYPIFKKDSLKARILPIPHEVIKYLEHDRFVLPLEAAKSLPNNSKWADGSPVTCEEKKTDYQPTFPKFSQQIQEILDEYSTVFIKTNWSTPADAMWLAPTKTLKCNTLEEIYLLLKSSDRIAKDLNIVKSSKGFKKPLPFCLVLKQWRNINPCTEFRCFVKDNELIAISQRDISQYHSSNEPEKYDIQTDIKSLFFERIKDRFPLRNYSFDVIRHEKDVVKVIDFGTMDAASTKETLFTYDELQNHIENTPEFRFIGEEIGIQPKFPMQFCVPQEISEFFQSRDNVTFLDLIHREVESQRKEHEKENANGSEST